MTMREKKKTTKNCYFMHKFVKFYVKKMAFGRRVLLFFFSTDNRTCPTQLLAFVQELINGPTAYGALRSTARADLLHHPLGRIFPHYRVLVLVTPV